MVNIHINTCATLLVISKLIKEKKGIIFYTHLGKDCKIWKFQELASGDSYTTYGKVLLHYGKQFANIYMEHFTVVDMEEYSYFINMTRLL